MLALRELAAPRRRAPDNAKSGPRAGLGKDKAHRRENLGYGGRRCLDSRKWSGGRNRTEHRAERRDHVLPTLGVFGAAVEQATPGGARDLWQQIRPTDPDQPDRLELVLGLIAERKRWCEQYERARDLAAQTSGNRRSHRRVRRAVMQIEERLWTVQDVVEFLGVLVSVPDLVAPFRVT